MARLGKDEAGGPRLLAFLDLIAQSEIGAPLLAASDDGYDVLVGSTAEHPHLFPSYDDHPQEFVKVTFGNTTVESSAAGRYQFLARTWDALARDMRFENFRPENQDRGALELIRECGAITLIRNDHVEDAVGRCAHIWASLPGAGYGQHENHMSGLLVAYLEALHKYTGAAQ
jgi:muramidase (phage lysozyme)